MNLVPMTADLGRGSDVVGGCLPSLPGPAALALEFLERLAIPEGPRAGELLRLAPFQRQFVAGALADGVSMGVLSIGRGNAKTALSAGLALGALLGAWGDHQPRREILLAARTRDQARIALQFCVGFSRSLPDDVQRQLVFRRGWRSEIEYSGDGGDHILRVIAADGKTILGSGPVLVILDERGHWPLDAGNELESALLTGLGKRQGRALVISTSAPDDAHPFSRLIDQPPPGAYVQEHRPPPGLPVDDRESILIANPGCEHGIGASLEWLEAQARQALARGGSSLNAYRLYHRNERISGENRDLLLTTDEWLACETDDLFFAPREGSVVVGIDLGGSASMSAASFYWPANGRLECFGWFPSRPSLLDRGQSDGVGNRYCEMAQRGELFTLGDQTVPVALWLTEIMRRIEGQQIAALVADRYKQSELGEAIDKAGIRAPIIWRGMGFRDGGEDIERFKRACFDGRVKARPSLLLRSAFSDAVCLRDPAANAKLAKARSTGRIDAAAASVLAVAEGARRAGRAAKPARAATWV